MLPGLVTVVSSVSVMPPAGSLAGRSKWLMMTSPLRPFEPASKTSFWIETLGTLMPSALTLRPVP